MDDIMLHLQFPKLGPSKKSPRVLYYSYLSVPGRCLADEKKVESQAKARHYFRSKDRYTARVALLKFLFSHP